MKRTTILPIGIIATTIALVTLVISVQRFTRNDDLNSMARSGNLEACQDLISNGIDVNAKGLHDLTPIMFAAKGGHPVIVDDLISVGANVNSHNESGSALIWAIDSQNKELIESLLMNGANSEWRNHMGETALNQANGKGLEQIVELVRNFKRNAPNERESGSER